jgi:hypothetical protein
MPFLARQIALDQQDGMYTSRAARDIGMDIDTLSPFWLSKLNLRGKPIPLDTVPPALAEKYLDKPLLGGSQWQSEVGTDQATVVVARMLAVGVTTINATGTIGALLGKVRTALRLPTLLFYLLARNLKTGSRTAAYLNSAVFIGALVVVGTRLYYYDTKPPLYNPTIVSFAVAVLIAMTLVLVMIGRPWLQWAAAIGLTITIGLALVRGHAALNWAIELLNNPEPWHKAALYEGAVLAVIGAGWLMPRPKWLWHEYAVPWFDQTWRNFDARMNLLFGGLIRLRARER